MRKHTAAGGTCTEEFRLSGFRYFEDTDSGTKKAPIVTTLESLRKDILAYATQLGLTPSGIKKINESSMIAKRESVIGQALKDVNGDGA